MWDHVTLRASDFEGSARFYDRVLAALAVERTHTADWIVEWGQFSISPANAEKPPTRRLHIGFSAASREHVDAFWEAGVEAGYRDDGHPGRRPEYGDDYYGGFLLDPDGNSAEAVHHDDIDTRNVIDHLWIRVADLGAATAFYAAILPHTCTPLVAEPPARARFSGSSEFSVVQDGRVTEEVHMAFPAPDREAVVAFHRDALAAGYRDNGGPGVRPEYHPGYYGAFVLDPDGNTIELVHHTRD